MTELERKAALALRPYMSKDPVIVDVGSNKGDWTAILGPGAGEVHLFEPNIVLLHYSMVRFDDAENFYFNNLAVFSESKELDFFYFTNSNNGLSSVYRNQKWVDMGLPMETGKVQAITLDDYFIDSDCKIDFLKIDVEGADFEVLKGADNLLNTQSIKFIQVEHSDHIKLSGSSWDQLVAYMESKGYFCYDFTGEFVRAFEPYTQENYYFMQDFTQDWNNEFKKNTKGLKVNFALEIGAFEGLTTCYICDNLLNPGGRVIVIDPLPDDHNQLPFGEDNKLFEGQYDRFTRNIKGYPVELIRKESRLVFKDTDFKNYRFDFIYIDGDHRADAVYLDGMNALNVCRVGGFILFDDYEWRAETKQGIDRFLSEYERCIEVVVRGYQVMVKKVKDVI